MYEKYLRTFYIIIFKQRIFEYDCFVKTSDIVERDYHCRIYLIHLSPHVYEAAFYEGRFLFAFLHHIIVCSAMYNCNDKPIR